MQASRKLRRTICFVLALLIGCGPLVSTSSYANRANHLFTSDLQDQQQRDNSARHQQSTSLNGLIAALNDPKTAWSATVALQKLGAEAVPALLENLAQDQQQPCSGYNVAMQALMKVGPVAIPLIAEEYQKQSPLVNRYLLIELLGEFGPPAIPALIDIAERDPANRASALDRAMGRDSWPLFDSFDDPWRANGPWSDRDQRAAQLTPLMPRLRKMFEKASMEPPASEGTAHTALASIVARLGDAAEKSAAVKLLLELGKTLPSNYSRRRALAVLVELRISAAADLIRRNVPTKAEDEHADQLQLEAARQLHVLGDPSSHKLLVALFESDDIFVRQNALRLAAQTLDLSFVPDLIKRLGDSTPTGHRISGDKPREEEMRELVLQSLERLTLQSIPCQPELWQAWWRQNGSLTRERLVQIEVAKLLSRFDATPFWQWNDWMNRLQGSYDPAVIPLIRRYVSSPLVSVRATGMHSGWGGCCWEQWPWAYTPPAVTLLLGLARKGNREATKLLYDCLESVDREVRQVAAVAISTFDRKTGLDFVAFEIKQGDQWSAVEAAEMLVRLGDARGVPGLIRFLQDSHSDAGRSTRYDLLRKFTQEDIEYNPDGDPAERDLGAQRWWSWWLANEKTFLVKVHAARVDRQNLTLFRQTKALKGQ